MATTIDRSSERTQHDHVSRFARVTFHQVLLACGVVYAVTYAFVNDVIAATQYDGYSRMSQAVSELSAIGAPTKPMLTALIPVWSVLMVAFGLGVWQSAGTQRSLRVTGAVIMAFGVLGLGWIPFPMSSRADMVAGVVHGNDVGHISMAALTVILIITQIVAGGVAFHGWFRIYSAVTVAIVLGFGSMTAVESGKVSSGDPTPWLGLFERINIWAWLLWLSVLAVTLLRAESPRPDVSPSPG